MKKLKIIILNYNSSDYSEKCIQSIIENNPAQEDLEYEIILVDNGSKAEDRKALETYLDKLKKEFECIKYLISEENLGFGGGNMLGYRAGLPSEYTLFLNNDCELPKDLLQKMIDRMEERKDVCVSSPQMNNGDNEPIGTFGILPGLGTEILGRRFLEWYNPKKHPPKKKKTSKSFRVDYVMGSFMLFKTDCFEKIQGFDPNIFLYYEEADLGYQLKKQGFNSFVFPDLYYIHHVSKSSSGIQNYELKNEYYRSLLYVVKKHQPKVVYWLLLWYFRLEFTIKGLFKKKYRKLIPMIWSEYSMKYSIRNQT